MPGFQRGTDKLFCKLQAHPSGLKHAKAFAKSTIILRQETVYSDKQSRLASHSLSLTDTVGSICKRVDLVTQFWSPLEIRNTEDTRSQIKITLVVVYRV